MDAFSKYVTVYFINSKTQHEIIRSLGNYFSIHGCPKYFLSDNAKLFKGDDTTSFLKSLGIKPILSSIRKSESRGAVERRVRTVNETIRFFGENADIIDIVQ